GVVPMSKNNARGKSFKSNKPIQFPIRPSDPPPLALQIGSELGQVAKLAFEEKRREDCLALALAILKIDPQHKVALMMQAWVQAELGQELGRARMLVQEAGLQKSRLYGEAESVLRSILRINPGFEDAKALLSEISLEGRRARWNALVL